MEWLFLICFLSGLVAQLALLRVQSSLDQYPHVAPWCEEHVLPQYARLTCLFGLLGMVWLASGVELLLLVLTLGMVALALIDKYVLEPRRGGKTSVYEFLTFPREVWVFVLMLFLVRNFVVQHYRVPTGSLEPTVKPGDFLLVNQFSYGWHVPIVNTPVLSWGKPKTGDIAVFRYPEDPLRTIYVKRVIGVPGDHIVYRNKQLVINGKVIKQDYVSMYQDDSHPMGRQYLSKRREYLPGATHEILVNDAVLGFHDDIDVVVPEHTYYMMGDNRDGSQDSRFFGPVSEDLLVGRAVITLFGWDGYWPSWARLGRWL